MDDIRNDRSIRNITSTRTRETPLPPPAPRRPNRGVNRFSAFLTLAAVLLVMLGAGLGVATLFAKTTLTLTPKTTAIATPATATAQLNSDGSTVALQNITTNVSATTTAPANSVEKVSRAATGEITISNAYSATAQRLITNTRFMSPDGLVYRIHQPVVIPGYTKSGSSVVPGTVTVAIYADAAGDSYNRTGATDFTIPGFKGQPQYTKITGHSANPISGGFVGNEPAISKTDLAAATSSLMQSLNAAITPALTAAMPAGYSIIQNSIKTVPGSIMRTAGDNNSANLSQTMVVTATVANTKDLARALATASVEGYKNEAVTIADSPVWSVSMGTTSPDNGTTQLTVVGSPTLVWQINTDTVRAALLGKKRADLDSILATFGSTVAAHKLSIRPFWAMHFPTNTANIEVKVAGEDQK